METGGIIRIQQLTRWSPIDRVPASKAATLGGIRHHGDFMADKRKSNVTFLLRFKGKTKASKIELFPAGEFAGKARYPDRYLEVRYRLRVNGAWYSRKGQKYSFFTKWEFRDMLWQSMPF